MAKNSVIRLPNGITIEITPDFKPDQINAIISSVLGGEQYKVTHKQPPVDVMRTAEEIWQSSKREKMALFIRNYFSPNLWFSAKDVLEEQLTIARIIVFGETSQIGTYLKRLHEDGLLDRRRGSGRVSYRISDNLVQEYPDITLDHIQTLVLQDQ